MDGKIFSQVFKTENFYSWAGDKRELKNQNEEIEIVKEIEFYQKQNLRRLNKIVFNEELSKHIIKDLHELTLIWENEQMQGYLKNMYI